MNKNVTVIVGTKWGDEGKGKIASREAKDAKLVIRATGGNNAGHTIVFNGIKLPLHLVTRWNRLSKYNMYNWTWRRIRFRSSFIRN